MPNTLSGKEWEALCDRCGLCCRFKNSEYCCPSLNVKTKQCMNYEKRFTKEVCLPVRQDNVLNLHAKGILPDSCAYVRHAKGKPPLEPEEVALVPFALAPLSLRRSYEKARKKWLKATKPYVRPLSSLPS